MNFDVIIRAFSGLLYCCIIIILLCVNSEGGVLVSIESKYHDNLYPALKHIKYCKNCPSAAKEGSMMSSLMSKHGLKSYSVAGELVYSIPNTAESNIYNQYDIKDKIAFVDRGKVTIIEKVRRLQQAGAIAVIIADTGECDKEFKSCGTRFGSIHDGGLSAYDFPDVWSDIKIPVGIITSNMAEKLRLFMGVVKRKIPGLGFQLVSIIDDEGDEDEEEEEDDHDEL